MNDGPACGPMDGGLDVVLVARHAFGGSPPLGDWQMARALGERNRVLYVNPPRRVLRPSANEHPRLAQPSSSITVMTPVAMPGADRPFAACLSDPLIAAQVRRVVRQRFKERAPVVLTFDPRRGTLSGLPRSLSVYWRRDRLADLTVAKNARLLGRRDERLMRRADLIVCTSPTLIGDADGISDAPCVHIPNGCEVDHFATPRPRPSGFPDAGAKVLGFVGGAFWRLDVDLLRVLAERHPEWHLVLLGGHLPELSSHPNVTCVDYIPYEEVPAWMQHLDVGLIPYDMTIAFNHGSFPIKAFEYLAAGVPVVSTAMPALEGFAPWIRRASTIGEFEAEIVRALEEGPGPSICQSLAGENTWADRAGRLESAISDRSVDLGARFV